MYRKTGCDPIEIGSPASWSKLRKESMLTYLAVDVFHNDKENEHVIAINELVGALRKVIRKKWKKMYGFSLKNYTSSAKYLSSGGMILRQVQNIAYRIVYHDLPVITAKSDDNNCLLTMFGSLDTFMNDMDAARKYKSDIKYLMDCFGLPDKPSIRKIVAKDMFAAPELKVALDITDNFDCNMAIYRKLNTPYRVKYNDFEVYENTMADYARKNIYVFLKKLSSVYSAVSLRHFVVNSDLSTIEDIVNLSQGVSLDMFTKPLAKMHDILVETQNRMKMEQRRRWQAEREAASEFEKKMNALRSCDAFSLNIPESVKRRFVMQVENGAQFLLPETNKDLNYTSEVMHNCVRGYDDRIYAQRCNIVYYTDNTGKLLACIEVQGNQVVQAKLKYNKHVAEDPAINQAILDWAKAKDLKIATADIALPSQEEDNRISA